mgnify:CR=1 FL=1
MDISKRKKQSSSNRKGRTIVSMILSIFDRSDIDNGSASWQPPVRVSE